MNTTPSTALQSVPTSALKAELRRRGLVLIVWEPGDMEGFGDPSKDPQERLNSVRKDLEDRCVERGWDVVSTLLGKNEEETEEDAG